MPMVLCPVCAKGVTLPVPWKRPTYTCPHCGHVFTGRKSARHHLRHYKVRLTAATAAEVERIVPIVNTALGTRVTRQQFFALAVAALAEKCAPGAAKGDDTSEAAVLTQRIPAPDGTETDGVSARGQP